MRLAREEFERLAEAALREVPREFLDLLVGLEIAVSDLPGPEAGSEKGSRDLLGLYIGPERMEMLSMAAPLEPARVLLYKKNIEQGCRTRAELAEEVRLTLRHELAHHFGFSDEELEEKWPEGA